MPAASARVALLLSRPADDRGAAPRASSQDGTARERAWAISHLLRYAQWDDIWTYVSRDEVREIFAELDLPENLRAAWARMLKVEAPVG